MFLRNTEIDRWNAERDNNEGGGATRSGSETSCWILARNFSKIRDQIVLTSTLILQLELH